MKVKQQYIDVIKKFPKTPIMVIGDLMVDKYVWGDVSRISPEAPVPVLEKKRESWMPGGAGNVINNLNALAADVYAVGIIGNDRDGQILIQDLNKKGVHTTGIVVDRERPTTTKTRIIARNQQIVRLDTEHTYTLNNDINEKMFTTIQKHLLICRAIIISDYGKGVINVPFLKKVIAYAKAARIPITVDPKVEHFQRYRGITCMTPNLHEARTGMHQYRVETEQDILALGASILVKLKCRSVLITRGEKGMDLFEKHKKPLHIPVAAREVYDVTGAGDTVISVLSLAIASGADIATAAQISNQAAGIVIGKIGTATVSLQELLEAMNGVIWK